MAFANGAGDRIGMRLGLVAVHASLPQIAGNLRGVNGFSHAASVALGRVIGLIQPCPVKYEPEGGGNSSEK